jgi:hypothetical protein
MPDSVLNQCPYDRLSQNFPSHHPRGRALLHERLQKDPPQIRFVGCLARILFFVFLARYAGESGFEGLFEQRFETGRSSFLLKLEFLTLGQLTPVARGVHSLDCDDFPSGSIERES